jgi:pimeloyl-ACP methyl ester carboxylesterase
VGEHVRVGELDIWTERVGEGPEVLLIGGLGDTVESWQFQLDGLSDRYRLTAFDNRGAGRTALLDAPLSGATMADDAAALLRALETPRAHVAGFSMGSAIAQELALRHPELVRSLVLVSTYARPDALWRSQLNFWRWLPEAAPSERAFFEGFFTWVYTPRAHADGSVDQIVEEALAFPHQQSVEAFSGTGRRLPHTRYGRPPLADRAADARPLRGTRHHHAAARRSIRRRGDPERAVRGHARGGPPALPGGPGRVQRPRRRFLARG